MLLETESIFGPLLAVSFFGLLSIFVLFYIFGSGSSYEKQAKASGYSAIPMAKGALPIFGHALRMVHGKPWVVMENWIRQYGPVVRFRAFFTDYYVVAQPDMIRQIFSKNLGNYKKDLSTYAPFRVLLGNGLVTSDGPLWRKQRNIVSPPFKLEMLGDVVILAEGAFERLSSHIDKLLAASPNGRVEVEIAEEFRKLTLQVIGEAVLSLTPEESDRVFPALYLPIVEEANRRVWFPWRAWLPLPANFQFNAAVKELDSYITKLIETRRELREQEKASSGVSSSQRKKDILDRILDGVEGEPWTAAVVNQLRDEIKTFVFAGHETSSMMLTWALYELILHPKAMAAALDEADRTFGDLSEPQFPSVAELKRGLPYSLSVLKEALRLYSVVPVVTRECVKADVLIGQDTKTQYYLPAGARVAVSLSAVHQNPDIWPQPEQFIPERFLESASSGDGVGASPEDAESAEKMAGKTGGAINPYHWLPFITGPRVCVGQNFALIEAKIVLSLLIQRYIFTLAPGMTGEKHNFNIPVCPVNGMRVIVERRKR